MRILLFALLSLISMSNASQFDQAMGNNQQGYKQYYQKYVLQAKIAQRRTLFKELFKKTYKKAVALTGNMKIPHIIHWIWIGPKKPPAMFKRCQESWIKKHPGWEFWLWTDADIAEFGMQNQAQFDASKNYGQKADIWRYEILHRYGGLYVDVDVECLNTVDLLHEQYDFYAGLEPLDTSPYYVGNALIACCPGHPILKAAIDAIKPGKDNSITGIVNSTGPSYFTNIVVEHITQSPDAIIFPAAYFYPIGWRKIKIGAPIKSYAIHHWAGSWKHPKAEIKR